MSFEPHEAAVKLRLLAGDMRAIADWLISNWQIDKDYSRRGHELLTAAIVVGYWADGIEAMINQGQPQT